MKVSRLGGYLATLVGYLVSADRVAPSEHESSGRVTVSRAESRPGLAFDLIQRLPSSTLPEWYLLDRERQRSWSKRRSALKIAGLYPPRGAG